VRQDVTVPIDICVNRMNIVGEIQNHVQVGIAGVVVQITIDQSSSCQVLLVRSVEELGCLPSLDDGEQRLG
jgi:hypothetical protein